MMNYDIVLKYGTYRGMERCFQVIKVPNKIRKGKFKELWNLELDYIALTLKKPSQEGFHQLIDYYRVLKNYEIDCEIIVFDKCPLTDGWGYPLELLGIDIVHDMAESLLADDVSEEAKQYLNENGLCKNPDEVEIVVPFLDHGEAFWEACYVYKVCL